MPEHLREMALFKVNTGLREQEVCQLRWEWEMYLPELGRSIFIIPGANDADLFGSSVDDVDDNWRGTKNGDDRIVVINQQAQKIIDKRRGEHLICVFTYRGICFNNMNNTTWQKAWRKAGLPTHSKVKQ